MDKHEVRQIVEQVLARQGLPGPARGSGGPAPAPRAGEQPAPVPAAAYGVPAAGDVRAANEVRLAHPGAPAAGDAQACHETQAQAAGGARIPAEASARHVHLTHAALEALFGPGAKLTEKRALSQPGEFLSDQRVRLVTVAGEIANVAVLGPERAAVQVELSATDARALRLKPPLNLSGNLAGAADVCLVGPAGIWQATGAVIIAKSHIHMAPADAARLKVQNGRLLRVRVGGQRPVVFEAVEVRVREDFALALHLDFDEANACLLQPGATAEILPD